MTKLSRDAASVSSGARKDPNRCPLCGCPVLYRGFFGLECAGRARPRIEGSWNYMQGRKDPDIEAVPACPNYREP